jgi:hypothetical protein
MRAEVQRNQLALEQSTFRAHWQELCDNILPRRARFYVTDVNKGDRRNQKIIDSTATSAARTLSAGMMAGVTSPARPWFRLITGDAEVDEQESVLEWLDEVRRRMMTAMLRSNLYNKLPILYGDLGTFGTAAMAIMEDDESIFRCYDFPIGTFYIANDDRLRVRTFCRVFRLSVDQVVQRWGAIDPKTGMPSFIDGRPTNISLTTQNLWKSGTRQAWVDIVQMIQPNYAYDGTKIESQYKRYLQIYYEVAAPNQKIDAAALGLLEKTGYDEFPIMAARWETNSEDVYATNCPGMTALGDIKQLQVGAKRLAQAVEKMINPPMTGPSALRTAKTSLLPGDITYLDTQQGQLGFRPVHEVNFGAAIGPMDEMLQACRLRIQRAFYEDLFLMLAESDRRQITAREIDERHEEKLLALGPMLEQLNQDVLDPTIDRIFNIMLRKGLLPPPPEEIQGMPLHVEYVSIMAQAQKQIGLAALERAASFAGQVAQVDPSILDDIDNDELMRQYFDASGVPPKILRDPKDVATLRAQRQQQAAAQQAAESAPKVAGAVKSLSQSPTTGDNALAALLGKARARQTLNATASPPAPVTP